MTMTLPECRDQELPKEDGVPVLQSVSVCVYTKGVSE